MKNDKSFSTNYLTHDNSKDNYRAIEFLVFYLIEAANSKRNLISKSLQINDFQFYNYAVENFSKYLSYICIYLYTIRIEVSIIKCKGLQIKIFFHCLKI